MIGVAVLLVFAWIMGIMIWELCFPPKLYKDDGDHPDERHWL